MRESSHYPRGTPYKAPPEAASSHPDRPALKPAPEAAGMPPAREPRSPLDERALRAWALKLALATVLAVAVLVAVGMAVTVRLLRPPSPVAAAQPVPVDSRPGPDLPPGGHDAASIALPPTAPQTTPPTVPAQEAPPPRTTRPTEKEPREPSLPSPPPPRDDLLDAVGSLLGAHLHQGYLNIGLLADAQENDVYEAADAKKVLGNVLALLDNVDQQITRLTRSNLDDDDRKKLAQAAAIAVLLRLQARELGAYWDTPEKDKDVKKDHESRYLKAREQAWTGIKELLDIKE